MSLINDALKRATQGKRRSTSSDSGAAMQPAVETASNHANALLIVIILIVVAGAGYGGWIWWKGRSKPAAEANATAAVKAKKGGTNAVEKPKSGKESKLADLGIRKKNPIERAQETGQKVQDLHKESDQTADALQSKAPPPSAASEPAKSEVPSATPKPEPSTAIAEFPSIKLQGILYRIEKPSALIDGKRYYVGEEVNGAMLVSIDQRAVKFSYKGQSREIALH